MGLTRDPQAKVVADVKLYHFDLSRLTADLDLILMARQSKHRPRSLATDRVDLVSARLPGFPLRASKGPLAVDLLAPARFVGHPKAPQALQVPDSSACHSDQSQSDVDRLSLLTLKSAEVPSRAPGRIPSRRLRYGKYPHLCV